jgi:DNA transformation protein
MARSKSNDFVTYVLDVLAPLGHVTSRPMFGGHNVALDGLTFAIIIGDVLFFKTDAVNRPAFESLGLEPFSYQKKSGEVTATSYFATPDCLDDWDALEPYARGGLAAAKRAKAPKPKKPSPKKLAAMQQGKPALKRTAKRR